MWVCITHTTLQHNTAYEDNLALRLLADTYFDQIVELFGLRDFLPKVRVTLRSSWPAQQTYVLILPPKVDNATNPLLEKLFITFCTDCESCCENVVELLCGRHQGAFNETLMPWLVTCVFLSSTHSAFA